MVDLSNIPEHDVVGQVKARMKDDGIDLDKINKIMLGQHLWTEGLTLFYNRYNKLPTVEELADEMWDEWDDPVTFAEARAILESL